MTITILRILGYTPYRKLVFIIFVNELRLLMKMKRVVQIAPILERIRWLVTNGEPT